MPALSISLAQAEARRQAQFLHRDVENYRKILPPNYRFHGGGGVCRADGWNVCHQQLDGDFDLDEVLAKDLVAAALNSTGKGNAPSPTSPASASNAAADSWLTQYFLGDPAGDVRSFERILSEGKNAAAGPGNILGNAAALKQAANAAMQSRTANALQAAARTIESGAASNVKINQYMTLYNANTSGKGRPRPRVRITGMPMQVVTPALGQGARMTATGANVALHATDALRAQNLGKLASDAHWTGKAPFLHGRVGGGLLTFAPSAALDIYNSVERDARGDTRFNFNKFMIASAKSQSGNLLGMAGGAGIAALAGAGAIAITGVALTAAPLLLIGFIGGVAIQMVWGTSGGADWAGSVAERALKR